MKVINKFEASSLLQLLHYILFLNGSQMCLMFKRKKIDILNITLHCNNIRYINVSINIAIFYFAYCHLQFD